MNDAYDNARTDREMLHRLTRPRVTRLVGDQGPFRRYFVAGEGGRGVTLLVSMPGGRHRLDHTIEDGVGLYEWPELFDCYPGYRDIPAGATLTDTGRGLLIDADDRMGR